MSAHCAGAAPAAADAAAGVGLASSVSQWPLLPCAEESSWLSAEGSKLSAAGGLLPEASAYGQRRAAIPAANRAVLDRQVRAGLLRCSYDFPIARGTTEPPPCYRQGV
jgi:hypothetical protein